jgi:indole-3-glycerol phosphate synthase
MAIHNGRATLLNEIVAHKRAEIAALKAQCPLAELQAAAANIAAPRDFAAALRRPGLSLIAEVKRASPSRGALAPRLDPATVAQTYAAHGAAAISVLTDVRFFQGNLDDLQTVRQAVSLPVLRKDFTLEGYQVYEARAAGADAILLIAAILDTATLGRLQELAHQLGMAALVEVHNRHELAQALAVSAPIIGINSRDLHTFEINLDIVAALRPEIPATTTVVAESGIHTAGDVRRLKEIDVDAMLVGTALITADDPAAHVRELVTAGGGSYGAH